MSYQRNHNMIAIIIDFKRITYSIHKLSTRVLDLYIYYTSLNNLIILKLKKNWRPCHIYGYGHYNRMDTCTVAIETDKIFLNVSYPNPKS